MKIVYFGSDVFLEVFRYMLMQHEILALYTYHNSEDYFNECNIVRLAHLHGIPVHYTRISEAEMIRWIDEGGCELFFVAEYSHKLPIPDHAAFRGINTHNSLLPEGRSYYPLECTMERGYKHGGVTIHKLTSTIDKGDILIQRRFDITEYDDSIDAYLYCAKAAREMVVEIFSDFNGFWYHAAKQTQIMPYWQRPDAEALTLSHKMTVKQAAELYRKFNKMTMVQIDGQFYYIDGFITGNAPIGMRDGDVIFVRAKRVLYGVTNGHLRLDIEAVSSEQEAVCGDK